MAEQVPSPPAPEPDLARRRGDPRKAVLVRLDPRLWEALERWARDDLRSVNGQIEYLLTEAARRRGRLGGGRGAE